MSIHTYKCQTCDKVFDSIEKPGTKITYCECGKIAIREGIELPSPHLFYDTTGAITRPAFGTRRYE